MRRRRLLLLSLVLALVLAWAAFLVIIKPAVGINQRAYSRIRTGMTEQEVEAHMGCLPGDYRAEGGRVPIVAGLGVHERAAYTQVWISEQCWIVVSFSADGTLLGKFIGNWGPGPTTWWEKALEFLGI